MPDAFAVTVLYFALTIALTWPLARGLTRDIPGDFGDPLFTSWVMAWDATHLGRGWWNANIFAPASAGAGVLRALSPAGDTGAARLLGDEQPDPRLQPGVPVDVRPLGPGNVSARPGADRKPIGRRRRGPRVRILALPHRVDPAPAGAVVGVDAVRPVRPAASFRHRTVAPACRRRRRVDRAEPVVRLLHAVLQPGGRPLHRLGADDARVVDRSTGAHPRGRRMRRGCHRRRRRSSFPISSSDASASARGR